MASSYSGRAGAARASTEICDGRAKKARKVNAFFIVNGVLLADKSEYYAHFRRNYERWKGNFLGNENF